MLDNSKNTQNEILLRIESFLQLKSLNLKSDTIKECVKEICATKLCEVIGLKCECNFENEFFSCFTTIVGEALSKKFFLDLNIAPYGLGLVRHNGVNVLTEVRQLLDEEDINKGFIQIYNLVNDHKTLLTDFNFA